MKPLVELINVSKFYRHAWHGKGEPRNLVSALDNISFSINPGEHIGVIGDNGAGKTTLLRAIGGTLTLDKGKIIRRTFPRLVISLQGAFLNSLTGRENIFMYGSFLGIRRRQLNQAFDDIVSFAQLSDVIDEPVRSYSRGMATRLAFAVATSCEPVLICIDEVVEAGDKNFRLKSKQRIAGLVQQGTTVIAASHNPDYIKQQTKRIIWLNHGRLVKDGSKEDIYPQYFNDQG